MSIDISGLVGVDLHYDYARFVHMKRALDSLPGRIRNHMISRAMQRVKETARSRVAKRSAERIKIPQKFVRERTRAATLTFNSGGSTQVLIVRSGWIHLYRLGARRTRKGVSVRGRGSYNHAFIAKMDSGHRGVFRRVGGSSLPIKELFGPNPASDISNNPDVYLTVLADVMDEVFGARLLHEIGRHLATAG